MTSREATPRARRPLRAIDGEENDVRRKISIAFALAATIAVGCSAIGEDNDDDNGSGAGAGMPTSSSIATGFGVGGSSSSSGSFGGGCGESSFGNEVSGALLVVLDKSGSMSESPGDVGPSKWQSTVAGINAMVAAANDQLQMGLLPYPAGNFDDSSLLLCLISAVRARVCRHLGRQWLQRRRHDACGEHRALGAERRRHQQLAVERVTGWQHADPLRVEEWLRHRPRAPHQWATLRAVDHRWSADHGDTSDGWPARRSAPTVAAITDIETEVSTAAAGSPAVNTFVIGSPGSEGAASFLSQLALNGNTPKSPNCSAGAGDCHYQIGSANFEQELAMALQDIAGQVSDCVFELPINENTDPNLVNVSIETANGTVDVYKDVSHQDGWDYTDGTQTKIQLFGPACELYKGTPGNQVTIILGCPTVLK